MASPKQKCPNVDRCELFPKFKTESTLAFCLDVYCHDDFDKCARFRFVQENQARPPSDLLPNGKRLPVV